MRRRRAKGLARATTCGRGMIHSGGRTRKGESTHGDQPEVNKIAVYNANDRAPDVRRHIHCKQPMSLLELFTTAGKCNSDAHCVMLLELCIDRNVETVRTIQSGMRHMLYEQNYA